MLDALAALIKALVYAALLCTAGAVFAGTTFARFDLLHTYANRIASRSALFLIVFCLAAFFLLIARLGGQVDEATLTAITSSSTGAALFMQLAGVTLLLAIGNDDSSRGMRVASASLIALSLAVNGHAATVGPFEGLFVFFHAAAAAWWMGSLLLLLYACRKLDFAVTAELTQHFGRLATQVIGVLVIAGMLLIYV